MTAKDQELFKRACRQILGHQFDEYYQYAREAYKRVKAQSDDFRQDNKALKAANLVLLDAIKSAGVTNWRQFLKDNEKPEPRHYQAPAMQQVQPMRGSGNLGKQEKEIDDFIQKARERRMK